MLYTILKHLYPQIQAHEFELRNDADEKGDYIAYLDPKYAMPTAKQLSEGLRLANIAVSKKQINTIAEEKIINIAPLYKQNNMLAAAIEASRNNDLETMASLQIVWDRIKAIREYSNELCVALETNPEVDITAGWPS